MLVFLSCFTLCIFMSYGKLTPVSIFFSEHFQSHGACEAAL